MDGAICKKSWYVVELHFGMGQKRRVLGSLRFDSLREAYQHLEATRGENDRLAVVPGRDILSRPYLYVMGQDDQAKSEGGL